ncbi:Nuclease HARBI1 [Phytophthora megakarya]|uniref:Nuclease HARBI1 n=1 Tax=Phytophthora megakarya TaxID=4795 RepID=A0A225VCB1_9STRA|nr:Nuclease HARBI1 [Phytophthora megakarya]
MDHFRMDKQTFDGLYDICKPYLSTKIKYHKEILAVTLDWLVRAASCGDQEPTFRLACSTVRCYRRAGLHAIIRALLNSIIVPRAASVSFTETFPFFDQTVAAIDGIHVPIVVAAADMECLRNRKGWTSTNFLIAADWEMHIVPSYILGLKGQLMNQWF